MVSEMFHEIVRVSISINEPLTTVRPVVDEGFHYLFGDVNLFPSDPNNVPENWSVSDFEFYDTLMLEECADILSQNGWIKEEVNEGEYDGSQELIWNSWHIGIDFEFIGSAYSSADSYQYGNVSYLKMILYDYVGGYVDLFRREGITKLINLVDHIVLSSEYPDGFSLLTLWGIEIDYARDYWSGDVSVDDCVSLVGEVSEGILSECALMIRDEL